MLQTQKVRVPCRRKPIHSSSFSPRNPSWYPRVRQQAGPSQRLSSLTVNWAPFQVVCTQPYWDSHWENLGVGPKSQAIECSSQWPSQTPQLTPKDSLLHWETWLHKYCNPQRQMSVLQEGSKSQRACHSPPCDALSPKGREVVRFKTGHIKSTASFFLRNSLE